MDTFKELKNVGIVGTLAGEAQVLRSLRKSLRQEKQFNRISVERVSNFGIAISKMVVVVVCR